MLKDLILRNRSYRRFHEDQPVARETLVELVDLARFSPSARNAQPLKYYLSCTPETNALIFPTLAWAGYLKDWDGPSEGERPTAYIIMLGDKNLAQNFGIDPGICSQSILLGAVEKGLGGCIIASIKRETLMKALEIPEQFEILYVLALGVPSETVVIEKMGADGDVKYWHDEKQYHHVPKRTLEELLIN